MMKPCFKYRYGDSWEKFPIREREIWTVPLSNSKIAVADIRDPLPFRIRADMVYMDPPWNQGNVNCFITKADKKTYVKSFEQFMDALFWQLASITAPVCYLEIGKQHKDDFISRLEKLYQIVDCWDITYYRKNPCCLCRGGPTSPDYDFTGLDDDVTPFAAVEYEQPESVADLCTGTGLTMLAAHKNHARFLGTELNRRRLAVAIEKAAAMGVHYEKSE